MMWIGTRVGPLYVGRRLGGGQSADPQSEGAKRLIAGYFLLLLVTFFTVPVVTGVLVIGFPVMFIAAMIMEVTHRGHVAEEAVSGIKTDKDERRAQIYRVQHLAGRTVTHRAAKLIARRPDLEFVVYPERKPVDPYQFLTEEDRAWYERFGGDIPEAS